MSNENSPVRFWIGMIVLVAVSIMMIVNPDMATGAEIEGRQTILKVLVAKVWSIPAGIIMLLLAGAAIYGKLKKKPDREE
ncbi:MAG: hypothetical protein WBA74_14060 [Cyclobacteriaceae bacterium]